MNILVPIIHRGAQSQTPPHPLICSIICPPLGLRLVSPPNRHPPPSIPTLVPAPTTRMINEHQRELVEFIFRTCKKNGSDELELGELVRLAESFHLANNAFRATFSQQLKDISRDQKEGKVILTLDFFLGIHHKCPMMLYPALRMQVENRTKHE